MSATVHGLTWHQVAVRHGLDHVRGWGVDDGWAELADRMLTDLEGMGWRWTPKTRLEDKYGIIRFEAGDYRNPPSYEGWPREWEDRVDLAEEESMVTCQGCGRAGTQVTIEGWVSTLCPACASERGAQPHQSNLFRQAAPPHRLGLPAPTGRVPTRAEMDRRLGGRHLDIEGVLEAHKGERQDAERLLQDFESQHGVITDSELDTVRKAWPGPAMDHGAKRHLDVDSVAETDMGERQDGAAPGETTHR